MSHTIGDLSSFLAVRCSGEQVGMRSGVLGSDAFLSKVECLLGRRVRPLPIGRQKGWRKKKTNSDTKSRKRSRG